MNLSQLINEILTEWAYRVDDGMPNPKNPTHLKELGIVLSEMGLSHIKNDLVENLLTEKGKTPEKNVVEADKTFKNAILNKIVKYKNAKGEDKEGMVGNLLRQPKGTPARDAAERMLPPEGSPERDEINKDLGGEGQPTKPEDGKGAQAGGEQPQEDPLKKAAALYDPKSDPAMAARLDKEKETLAKLAGKDTEEKPQEEPKKDDGFDPIPAADVQSEIPEADPETFGGASDIPDGIDKEDLEGFNTDIKKVRDIVDDAKAKGEKAPNINLCQVTVPGTNLYCDDNLGIPREEMPQFKGKPQPGTPAADMPVDENGEVDTEPLFKKMLKDKNITVTQTEVPADKLKATQNELVGAKVVGMIGALEKDPTNEGITAPIYVSRDGYVIDGHHRWAAIAAYNAANPDTQIPMKVQVIDMDIKDAIPMANKFAEEQGVAAKKADANKETPSEPKQLVTKEPEEVVDGLKGRTTSQGDQLDVETTENGSMIIGVEHGEGKESTKETINQITSLPKDTKVMFVGEGGMSKDDAGNIDFSGEQKEIRDAVKGHFDNAEESSWDENANVNDDNSPVFDEVAKSVGGSKSKSKAAIWSNMVGQGDELNADDYLDEEGKDWLISQAKAGGSNEFDGDVDWNNLTDGQKDDLFQLNYRDNPEFGETEISKAQTAYNNFRQSELDRKIKEAEAEGYKVIAPVGNSHVDAYRKRKSGEETPEETPTEKLPEPKEPSTKDGGVVYSLGGGYYSDTPGGPAQYRIAEDVVEKVLLEGDESLAYLLFEATVTKKTAKGKTVKLKTIGKSKQKAATAKAKAAAKKPAKSAKKPAGAELPTLLPQQQIQNSLLKNSLSDLFKTNEILGKLRDRGIAGAGGAVASYGENLTVNTTNSLQKIGGFEGFVSKNKTAIKQKEKFILSNISKFQKQIDTIATQLGFTLPEDKAKVIQYIAARMAFTDKEIERIKADKKSLYYKKGKEGFGENDEAVEAWCKAAFDGAISTLIDLENDSLLDLSKPFIVMQSNPKEGGHDAPLLSTLEKKLEEAKAKGNKEEIKHYEMEVFAFKMLGFHDTFAVGYTPEGRLTIKHISNKKQDDLQDIWGNTTPEYALNLIKSSFGPKVSEKVVEVIEDGILKVKDSKAATTKLFSKMKIDDQFVAVCDTKQMKPYIDDLKAHKKFNAWLKENGIKPKKTAEWLKYAQQYVKKTPDASYGTFGKLVHKVGEFSQIGKFKQAYGKINFNSASIKTAINNKNEEKELVASVHNQVAESIATADKALGFPDKTGKNGPHTQAYLTVVMHSMHFDYMVENYDKRFSALTGIRASHPADFRGCLENLSGYKRNPKHDEATHRKSLMAHLIQKCKINPQTKAIEITDQGGTKVLAEDTWRTAGTSQKVEKKLGGSLRECIANKVDARQKQRRQKK